LLRQETDGLVTYQFEHLATEGRTGKAHLAMVHAVFTRLGGVSVSPFATLNVGRSVGDDAAAVAENHARIYEHLAMDASRIATAGQVHSNRVAVVTARDGGRMFPNTDGLVTDEPGMALMLRFADCQPILLYDPVHYALGLAHAGWRGVAQGVALRVIERMEEAFGSHPSELIAGLGPAIGPCCYTVGHDVAAAMGYALPDWGQAMTPDGEDEWRLDLPAANAQQLAAAGIRTIEQANLCTACHRDEFFSHRAEGGRTGRFAVVAYLLERARERGIGASSNGQVGSREKAPGLQETTEVRSLHPPGFPPFGEPPGVLR
jgi:YfiH family protein